MYCVRKLKLLGGGRDHMVVRFTTICAINAHHKVVSLKPVHGKVYSIQHYVIFCH